MASLRLVLRSSLVLGLCAPLVVSAGIGKAQVVDGEASRQAKSGTAAALKVGSEVEVGDTLRVKKGNVKLVLTDASVVMLGEGSELVVDEATFEKLERRSVSLRLVLGALWSSVTRGAPYEVMTDRAVAGVRGTTFRVDVVSSDAKHPATCVCVSEGAVGVWSGVEGSGGARADGGLAEKAPAGSAPHRSLSRPGWTPRYTLVEKASQLVADGAVDLHGLKGHPDAFQAFIDAHR